MSDTKQELLRSRLPFWGRLREAQRESVLTNARSVRFKKGSVIADIGDDCGVIIVRRGRVCLFTVSEDGRETALLRVFSGDVCLLSSHRAADTTGFNLCIGAETEADLIIIDSAVYDDICRANVYAATFTRELLSKHLHDIVLSMQNMLLSSPESRIAAFLTGEVERTGQNRVRITHEILAKQVGTAREVVSRTLGRLSESGIVALGRGVITVTDRQALRSHIK